MPPPPRNVWLEVNRRANALSETALTSPAPYLLSGNYRGVFEHLSKGADAPGVSVVWPRGDIESAKDNLENRLDSDTWASLASAVGSATSLFIPLAGLVVAAAKAGHKVWTWLDNEQGGGSSAHLGVVIRELVKAATASGPVVLLLDGVDRPDRQVIWYNAYFTLASYQLSGLQIVGGIDTPVDLATSDSSNEVHSGTSFVTELRQLVADGGAECDYIPPLDGTRIRAWLGKIESSLVDELLASSGAQDVPASTLWGSWLRSEYVRTAADGTWHRSGTVEPTIDGIHATLALLIAPIEMRRAFYALRLASLSGPLFSGSAVCRVIANNEGVSPDDVEDLLDRLTPLAVSPQPWLIETMSSVRGSDGTSDWFYRFGSEYVRQYLATTFSSDELVRASSDLFETGAQAHGFPDVFTESAANLAVQAGRSSDASKLLALNSTTIRTRQLVTLSHILLDAMEAPEPPPSLFHLLLSTGQRLRNVGLLAPAQQVCQAAVDIAREQQTRRNLAVAALELGLTAISLGDPVAARPPLEESAALLRCLYEEDPSSDHRGLLTTSLGGLANLHYLEGDYSARLRLQREQLEHAQAAFDSSPEPRFRAILVDALSDVATSLIQFGEYEQSIHLLNRSVDHCRTLVRQFPTPRFVEKLGNVLAQLGEAEGRDGDCISAETALKESVAIQRQLHSADPNRRSTRLLADGLGQLSEVESAMGKHTDAQKLIDEALVHLKVLHNEQSTPASAEALILGLRIAAESRRLAEEPGLGRESLFEAVSCAEELAKHHDNPHYARILGGALLAVGRLQLTAGDTEAAIASLRHAVEQIRLVYEAIPDEAHRRDLSAGLKNLAEALEQAGRKTEANRARADAQTFLS